MKTGRIVPFPTALSTLPAANDPQVAEVPTSSTPPLTRIAKAALYAAWLILRTVWPVLQWIVALDVLIHFLTAALSSDVHNWIVFSEHLIASGALNYFALYYKPPRLSCSSS